MQVITFTGRLGKDAELKYTPSGKPVLEFSVAVNEYDKQPDGTFKQRTEWFECNWWGNPAEKNGDHMKKGTDVTVQGRQYTQKWEDKQGNKQSKKVITCDKVKFFSAQPKNNYEAAKSAVSGAQNQDSNTQEASW